MPFDLRRVVRLCLSVPVIVLFTTLVFTIGLAQAGACTGDVPMGAIAPARPIWCEMLTPGRDTHTAGTNSWVDEFNHGQSMARLNPAYVEGFFGPGDVRHFQHNEHWMLDIESHGKNALIGAWMRPNRSFRTQSDGWLVVEFVVAGPIAGTRDADQISDSWPEFVLSTAPAPPGVQSWGSALRKNGTYLYEAFPGFWTFGCRMQQSRHPICALYMNDLGTAGTKPSRLWEINQNGGEVTFQYGGDPTTPGLANVWKSCNTVQDPDVVCRNHFRWEIRANEVRLFVNGVLYYQAGLIDSALNNILNAPGGVHVFFGDFAYRMSPGRPLRFHWDRIAINPNTAGSVGGGVPQPPPAASQPTPTPTPTRPAGSSATPTPTRTPTPSATPTRTPATQPSSDIVVGFEGINGHSQPLNGQFPSGVIDWGTDQWYHSKPIGALPSKSVSFTSTRFDSTFTFVGKPRQMKSVQIYNGAKLSAAKVTVSCAGQPTRTVNVNVGQVLTLNTGWTGTCSSVKFASTTGWRTNFDNLTIR